MKAHATREGWLHQVTLELAPIIKERTGIKVPKGILLSCGFPRGTRTAIGQCFPGQPGTPVFISPAVHKPLDVTQVLVHELLHAGLKPGVGHGRPFANAARMLNLGGKPTATIRTTEFDAWAKPIVDSVGPYPHKLLDPKDRTKQGTRMLKLECDNCGYIVRTTSKWIDQGVPSCYCGGEFEVSE